MVPTCTWPTTTSPKTFPSARVVRLARSTETGIYFVHTTAKEGVAAIAEARAAQLPVYGEALHNYLEFTCDDYLKPDGLAIHTYPAIKYSDDRGRAATGAGRRPHLHYGHR